LPVVTGRSSHGREQGCTVSGDASVAGAAVVLTRVPAGCSAAGPATLSDEAVSACAALAPATVKDSVRTSASRAWPPRARGCGAFTNVESMLFMVVALLLGR
jgi:hypothetical protein